MSCKRFLPFVTFMWRRKGCAEPCRKHNNPAPAIGLPPFALLHSNHPHHVSQGAAVASSSTSTPAWQESPVNGSVPPSITDSSRIPALTCILQLYTFQFVGGVVPSLFHTLFHQQHSVPDCQRVSQTAEPHAVFSTQLLSFQQ